MIPDMKETSLVFFYATMLDINLFVNWKSKETFGYVVIYISDVNILCLTLLVMSQISR